MKLIGLMPVRNEAWCLALSLRVALQWCDEVIVLDHASTDGTRKIVEFIAQELGRVHFVTDRREGWPEMEHRQMLLNCARLAGATHIAIIDADEVLSANVLQQVRNQLLCLPAGYALEVPGYNLRKSIWQYHSTGIWARRWFSIGFADRPDISWLGHGDTFHRRLPQNLRVTRFLNQGEGGVLHLWGVDERRLAAKHRLYRITERLRWPEKNVKTIESEYLQWREEPPTQDFGDWITIPRDRWPSAAEPWRFKAVPEDWWKGHEPACIGVDEIPWQEAEADRLIALYGREMFKGLSV